MQVMRSRALAGALAAMGAASVLLIGCTSDPAPPGAPTTPITATPQAEGTPPEVTLPTLVTVAPGEPAALGYQQRAQEQARATLFGVRRDVTPAAGSTTPRTAIDIEVCADAPISGISSSTWTVISTDGTEYRPTPGDDAPIIPVYPTRLTALKIDQCLRGWVVVDVPADAQVATVRYTPENGAVLLWTA